jgi:6-pyruvoyl-tetrahydropterin synthase
MYRIESGVFIHFSHHVRGHSGPCISLHGHTWKFVLLLGANSLDEQGFVLDFDELRSRVFEPCHRLLDHSLALGVESYHENSPLLAALGENLVRSRQATLGSSGELPPVLDGDLGGARNELPGGIKVAVFPFTPTSERLAEWLHGVALRRVGDSRVTVLAARVYESLHPVEMFAEYAPE